MFFDTNIIINILGSEKRVEIMNIVELYVQKREAFISVIVYGEMLGFQKLNTAEKESIKEYLTDNYIIYDVTKDISELAAEIVVQKRLETGKKLKLTDAMIAATAIKNNKQFFTLDQEDFSNITSLRLLELVA